MTTLAGFTLLKRQQQKETVKNNKNVFRTIKENLNNVFRLFFITSDKYINY